MSCDDVQRRRAKTFDDVQDIQTCEEVRRRGCEDITRQARTWCEDDEEVQRHVKTCEGVVRRRVSARMSHEDVMRRSGATTFEHEVQ